jgi:hypothetical protein
VSDFFDDFAGPDLDSDHVPELAVDYVRGRPLAEVESRAG